MTIDNDNVAPKFATMEENMAHAKIHNRWYKLSLSVVGVGMLLGVLSKLFIGRELKESDPYIGPFLLPFAFMWCVSFMYVFYVMIEIRISRFTRWLYCLFCALTALFLGKFFVVDAIARYFQN